MGPTYSYIPNAEQELLLKAALLDGEIAVRSWRAWRARVRLDDVDHGSARLVPLLLDNLQRLGVQDGELQRYQNVARHAWLESLLLARNAAAILQLFSEGSIPTMALKGLALAPLYYGNVRLRPMGDIDILVPVARVREAAGLLVAAGWQSLRYERMAQPDYFSTHHSSLFVSGKGVQCDLHWHVFEEGCRDGADDDFWSHAQRMSLGDVKTSALCDTDQLFHALVHGGRVNDVAPIRWVADCALVLRHGNIDWNRLIAHARTFAVALRIRKMARYLNAQMELPVPRSALAALQSLPVTGTERFGEAIEAVPIPDAAKIPFRRYAHYRRTWVPDRKSGFLSYLKAAYGTRTLGETVRWGLRRMTKGVPRLPSRDEPSSKPSPQGHVVEAVEQEADGDKHGHRKKT